MLRSLYYCLFVPFIYHMGVILYAHSICGEPHSAMPTEGLQQHPLLFTMNRTDGTFFLWSLHLAPTSHPGHSSIFRDRKAWAACVQSFILWQQATIEITCHDHSIIACLRHLYMGVVLCAHSVCGEPHIQRNANRGVATVTEIFQSFDITLSQFCQN